MVTREDGIIDLYQYSVVVCLSTRWMTWLFTVWLHVMQSMV